VYDKFSEITAEHAIKGNFCDLAISGVQLLRKCSVVSYWIEGKRERKRV